jgi:hypothetical protein
MTATYLVKDKKMKQDLLKSHHKHKIEKEDDCGCYFVCTRELLEDMMELRRGALDQ